jgi:hypothetical protein
MRSMVACTAAVPSTSRTPRRRGGRRCTAVYQPTPPALPVAGGWYGREAGCAGPRRLVGGTPSASLSARSLGRVQRQGNRTGACDGRNGEVGEGLRGARSELWEHGREPPPRRGGRLGDARHRRREPSSPPSPTRCASASHPRAPDPSRFDRPIVRRHVRRVGRSSTGASAGTDISGPALPRDVDVGAAVCQPRCYRMGWCWRAAGWSPLGLRPAR